MSGRKLRRRREFERAIGFAICDAASARAATVALAALLNEDAHIFGAEPMTDISRAEMHDQIRRLIGLPPIRTIP